MSEPGCLLVRLVTVALYFNQFPRFFVLHWDFVSAVGPRVERARLALIAQASARVAALDETRRLEAETVELKQSVSSIEFQIAELMAELATTQAQLSQSQSARDSAVRRTRMIEHHIRGQLATGCFIHCSL